MVISHGLNLCLWILHAPRSVPLVSHHFAPSAFPALHSWGSCVKTSLIVQPWTVPLSASVEPIQNQLCYACMHACMLSCVLTLCDSKDYSLQAPLSMGFSRQESWSGLPYHPLEDLPDPGIEPTSLASPALAGRCFSTEPLGKTQGAPLPTKYFWNWWMSTAFCNCISCEAFH